MNDLYLSLDLDEVVDSPHLIADAIAKSNNADATRAARYILLDPEKKQAYDRLHRVLSTIGQLRAQLALPRSQQWEALGNQDFDCDISPWTDVLDAFDDLDLLSEPSLGVPSCHLPSRGPTISPKQIGLAVAVAVCLALLLSVVAISRPTFFPLPENGTVDRYVNTPVNSKIRFTCRRGAGHNSIELVSVDDQRPVLKTFVRDGQAATVDVASGRYELRFSVGRDKDWNGSEFRRELRKIESTEIFVRTGQTWSVEVP